MPRTAVAGVVAGLLVLGVGAVASDVTAAPRADLQQVEQQVRELQMRAEAATERANEAQVQLNEIQSDLSAVQNRAEREKAELRAAMSTIDDIARATYSSGGMDPTLEVLLAEDPEQFLAQAAVMGQLEKSQVDGLRRARTVQLRVAQTQAEIADREQAAQQARDAMASAQGQAASELAAAEDVLAGLEEAERKRLEEIAAQRRADQIAEAKAAAEAAARELARNDASNANTPSNSDSTSSDSSSSDSSSSDSSDEESSGSGGGGQDTGPSAAGGGYTGGARAAAAVSYALSQVGDRYVAAADGPDSFDCSGLTMTAWRQAGVSLPHYSYSQFSSTRRVPVSEIQPGDLVFYFGSGAHHVGMYVGNGKMVSASNPSDGVELIDFLGPWYGERFSGVGRVVG